MHWRLTINIIVRIIVSSTRSQTQCEPTGSSCASVVRLSDVRGFFVGIYPSLRFHPRVFLTVLHSISKAQSTIRPGNCNGFSSFQESFITHPKPVICNYYLFSCHWFVGKNLCKNKHKKLCAKFYIVGGVPGNNYNIEFYMYD